MRGSQCSAWMLVVMSLLAGCGTRGSANRGKPGASSATVSPAGDLSRDVDLNTWAVNTSGEEPLTIAEHLAKSAGGTWVALAPHPLELIHWKPQRGGGTLSVEAALKAIQKLPVRVTWKQRSKYTLLYFGASDELARLGSDPPTDVTGLCVVSPAGESMVHALEDVLHVRVQARPEVYRRREAILDARQRLKKSERDEDEPETPVMRFRRRGRSIQVVDSRPQLEIRVADRIEMEEFMSRLAGYFGAEARRGDQGVWELAALTEPAKIAAEIGRQEDIIKEKGGGGGFTSFAMRSTGQTGEDDSDVSAMNGAELPEVDDDVQEAFDGLALLGSQAIPTINSYLDAAKPDLAQPAIAALEEMGSPESRKALVEFARRLSGPQRGKAAIFAPLLRKKLLRQWTHQVSAETAPLLAEIAQSADASPAERLTARSALLGAGRLSDLPVEPAGKEIPAGELDLAPAVAPGEMVTPKAKAKGVIPVAQMTLPNGDVWAVFTSGRLGNPDDVWLARGSHGQWAEFLFTGAIFPRTNQYGNEGKVPAGACTLQVKDDAVDLKPPNVSTAAELQRLMKQFQGGMAGMDPKKIQANMQRMQQLQQQEQGKMSKPLHFSLAELRKDSDHDGLPDLVEARLGLDPTKADTDGDGVNDGRDANPRVRPGARGDRVQVLQTLFGALYGGDPSREPILVQLEQNQWQELSGARARVICATKEECKQHTREWSGMRMLQFGGPEDAQSTILRRDGPCLFSDNGRRAEVHFWQWSPAEPAANPMYGMASEDAQPRAYVARFEKSGSQWKLSGIQRWRWLTIDRAMQERQQDEQTGIREME